MSHPYPADSNCKKKKKGGRVQVKGETSKFPVRSPTELEPTLQNVADFQGNKHCFDIVISHSSQQWPRLAVVPWLSSAGTSGCQQTERLVCALRFCASFTRYKLWSMFGLKCVNPARLSNPLHGHQLGQLSRLKVQTNVEVGQNCPFQRLCHIFL